MMRHSACLSAPLLALALAACPPPPAPAPPGPPPAPPPVVDDGLVAMAPSTRNALVWQRGTVLKRGLAKALFVPEEDLCKELDRFDCADVAHQVPLGGNDAFVKGQYEPLKEPGATTAIAFDRLALAACATAVSLEAGRPAPFLFRGHPLTDDRLAPGAADTVEGARFLATELYQRLHARAPREAEVQELLTLLVDDEGQGVSGRDYAVLACFAVAATTETLFF